MSLHVLCTSIVVGAGICLTVIFYINCRKYLTFWGERCRSWLRHCAPRREVPGSILGRILGELSSDVYLLSARSRPGVHLASNRRDVHIIFGVFGVSVNVNVSSVNIYIAAMYRSVAEAST
jgi:hypothetical protein